MVGSKRRRSRTPAAAEAATTAQRRGCEQQTLHACPGRR